MIKATELRIGNLVYSMGEIAVIDAVHSDGGLNILADSRGNIASHEEIVFPIPLTPEIFKKCLFANGFPIIACCGTINGIQIRPETYMMQIDEEHQVDRIRARSSKYSLRIEGKGDDRKSIQLRELQYSR